MGHPDRSGQGARHRPLTSSSMPQPARRLPRHDLGPLVDRSGAGRAYGLDFPPFSRWRTWSRCTGALLAHLGIDRLHGAVGGSLGGMQVLQWAVDCPGAGGPRGGLGWRRSSRLTAQNIAFSAVARGRRLSCRDPDFLDGRLPRHVLRHAPPTRPRPAGRPAGWHILPTSGRVAGGEVRSVGPGWPTAAADTGTDFTVESYLDHQAAIIPGQVRRALSYLYPDPGDGLLRALRRPPARLLRPPRAPRSW